MEYPYLERLPTARCRELLPAATVGRLAVPTPTFPTVEPVSFALVEGELVIAVRAGSAGDAIAAGTQVAFEADVLDHQLRSGWSVTVNGSVEYLDAEVAKLVAPKLSPWLPMAGDRLLLIRADRISGQRVVAAPETLSVRAPGPDPVPLPSPIAVRRRVTGADEGLARLSGGGQRVGRLVISVAGEPLIFPVNYALDGDAVIFRTHVGTKLSGITRSMAAFAVDHIDASGEGWSVVVQGLAQEVIDADPVSLRERIAATPLETWPGGDRPNIVRITPYLVQGTDWAPVPALVGPAANAERPAP
jgi:nitroimidazol reductase NimA-like FMN-containing flavoprotein (pyridoxamine 5'-phosphate oxidase superfamily)